VAGQLATAALLFEEGDFDGAEAEYQAILKQDPQNAAALDGLRTIERALKAEPSTRDTPLTEDALTQLIGTGLPAGRLRVLIASAGLDFELPDPEAVELRLRRLGLPAAALTALSPPANPTAGATWMSPLDRRVMVYVPAGRLRMGSPPSEQGRDDDETLHEVGLSSGFWMDVTEVSNEAYRRFILSRPEWQKGKVRPEMAGNDYLKNWNRTDHPAGMGDAPVEFVSWHAARAYANWAGKRLPTELEWEYAARAGTTTRFWWGDQFEPQRVAGGDRNLTAQRPALRTNPWGLQDITGSVWEWTLSLNLAYPYIATDARQNPAVPGARVIRGGSRENGEAMLRTANRNAENATTATDLLGFRCAR
jgi:formylglycine-generating enzyme required for sulfatase activity